MGDHLTHRFNPELGAGRVAAVEGRVIVVQFATATLRFAASSDALIPEVEGADRKELTLIERLVAGEIDDTDEDPKGRVARLEVHIPGEGGRGIVAIYKDGPQFDVRAIDSERRHRPEWAEAFRRRPLRAVRMRPADAAEYDWSAMVTRLAPQLGDRPVYAIAAVRTRSG